MRYHVHQTDLTLHEAGRIGEHRLMFRQRDSHVCACWTPRWRSPAAVVVAATTLRQFDRDRQFAESAARSASIPPSCRAVTASEREMVLEALCAATRSAFAERSLIRPYRGAQPTDPGHAWTLGALVRQESQSRDNGIWRHDQTIPRQCAYARAMMGTRNRRDARAAFGQAAAASRCSDGSARSLGPPFVCGLPIR